MYDSGKDPMLNTTICPFSQDEAVSGCGEINYVNNEIRAICNRVMDSAVNNGCTGLGGGNREVCDYLSNVYHSRECSKNYNSTLPDMYDKCMNRTAIPSKCDVRGHDINIHGFTPQ